jgi:uncharacterized protein (DUF1778 family)
VTVIVRLTKEERSLLRQAFRTTRAKTLSQWCREVLTETAQAFLDGE